MNYPMHQSAHWWRRHGTLSLVILVLILAMPVPTYAAEIRNEDIVVIGPDEVINDNLIVLADQFTLQGRVNGRLYVVANTITIDGTVTSDINAVGRQVIMNGTAQSVRMAGLEMLLGTRSRILGEAFLGALRLMQRSGSQINGSFAFVGASALLSGQIGAPASSSAMGLFQPVHLIALSSDVSRATFSEPGMSAPGQQTREERQAELKAGFMYVLRGFLSLLILGLLMTWLTPGLLQGATTQLRQKIVASLLWGLVALPALVVFVLAFILALVLLVMAFNALGLGDLVTLTVIFGGLSLIALITGIVVLLMYVGNIITGYLIGKLLLQRSEAKWAQHRVVPLVLGVALISVLSSLPGLGFAVHLIAMLAGLGALWLLFWRTRLYPSAAPVPVTAVGTAG